MELCGSLPAELGTIATRMMIGCLFAVEVGSMAFLRVKGIF